MKITNQICIIFGLCLLADFFSVLISGAIPSGVIGLLLIVVLLTVKILKEVQIRETADFLLNNMSLLFVPAGVGVIYDIGIIQDKLLEIFIVLTISLILTFFAAYFTAVGIMKFLARREQKHELG